MNDEKNTLNNLINYLKQHSYPENSFAIDFNNGHGGRMDLAIIDKVTNVCIQLFEVKTSKDQSVIESAITRINDYRKYFQNTNVSAYLVYSRKGEPFFELLKVNESEVKPIEDVKSELNYETQKNSRLFEAKRNADTKQESTIDEFKYLSWSLAFITLSIVILEKTEICCFQLDSLDFSLLLTIIVLLLIPYFSRIKFGNVEIERLNHNENIVKK